MKRSFLSWRPYSWTAKQYNSRRNIPIRHHPKIPSPSSYPGQASCPGSTWNWSADVARLMKAADQARLTRSPFSRPSPRTTQNECEMILRPQHASTHLEFQCHNSRSPRQLRIIPPKWRHKIRHQTARALRYSNDESAAHFCPPKPGVAVHPILTAPAPRESR